ncbi:MAG: SAP domain-containing protein [Treponema sp.]|nr:SAP domain-containing protein [Treponema sp.]
MNNRPPFSEIKSFEEFSKYYWYREELQKICRSLRLKSDGGKIELNKVIESYFRASRHPELVSGFATNKIQKKIPKRVRDDQSMMLSLNTSLIECGFTFGPRFREFFEKETGIKPFKFNVDMVATAKKVKETKDASFSLGDLLDIYYGKKTYARYDKSALQWNKFVQDFCADPATERFPNKLKAAAKLWKIVRESTREKVYTHDLLNELNIL